MALTVKLLIVACIVMQLSVQLTCSKNSGFESQLELLTVHVCIYGIFSGTVSFIFKVH